MLFVMFSTAGTGQPQRTLSFWLGARQEHAQHLPRAHNVNSNEPMHGDSDKRG